MSGVFKGANILLVKLSWGYNTIWTLQTLKLDVHAVWSSFAMAQGRNFSLDIIWTASSEFGTYRLCEQRRFRRAFCIRAVSPEPSLLAHTSSESRRTFRQKARSLAPLNGWACAVKICHDGMLEDTNSLDAAHFLWRMAASVMSDQLAGILFCVCLLIKQSTLWVQKI